MSTSSLHNKTIRPGSLNGYSYYYSSRQKQSVSAKPRPKRATRSTSPRFKQVIIVLLILAVPVISFKMHAKGDPGGTGSQAVVTQASNATLLPSDKKTPAAAPTAQIINYCAGNTLDQLVKVSVSKRHAWACEGDKIVKDFPVITGMEAHAETLTPVGTYKVYGKQQDTRLTGSDVAGKWNYPVDYWMPFLSNQHGIYGFHDATWRSESEFGNVDPNSDKASHGCVELPSADMAWLFNWSKVGTTLTVEA